MDPDPAFRIRILPRSGLGLRKKSPFRIRTKAPGSDTLIVPLVLGNLYLSVLSNLSLPVLISDRVTQTSIGPLCDIAIQHFFFDLSLLKGKTEACMSTAAGCSVNMYAVAGSNRPEYPRLKPASDIS